jgi:CRP-like cAMP-binding protein
MKKTTAFSGSLSFLSLADVLQLLGSNGSTGLLRLNTALRSDAGSIYLVRGNPVDASLGALKGIDALFSLFGWIDGEFEFCLEDVTCENVIQKSRMEVILTALKMLDDGEIEAVGLPDETPEESMLVDDRFASIPVIKGPLIDYWYIVDEENFETGTKIVEQGKHGNWIWVILEGVVEIRKETARGTLPILRIGTGSFVGSLASIITGSNVRSATTVAINDVQLGVLDSQRLANEFARLSPEFKDFLASLDRRLRQVTDKAVEAFEKSGHIEEFVSRQNPVITQGSRVDEAFVISQGEAFVVRETGSGDVLLADLYRGDFFGNISFLDIGHEPGAAAIYGSKALETRKPNLAVLKREFFDLSPTFHNFIEHMAHCITATSAVACGFMKKTFD